MNKLLCQVCGGPAVDTEPRLIPWLLTKTVFERTGLDSGRTNAPPTCWSCIPKALEQCPMLRADFTLYTVRAVETVGVLADLYRPGVFREPIPTAHNVFVPWDAPRYHPRTLAVAQVLELHGMKSVGPLLGHMRCRQSVSLPSLLSLSLLRPALTQSKTRDRPLERPILLSMRW
ncbi:hypothetical protein [Nonomuraea guangzhouensis]|uniref:Uncharacterized protein n=1 Tax=Nonomuraea guangzhouensis TaxID=1291555 RepID=A0ABW4GCF0_9ACTN|nr:hypothetical protein [Nonomuraea guangzhouensis]